MIVAIAIAALLGAAIGALIAWLIAAARAARLEERALAAEARAQAAGQAQAHAIEALVERAKNELSNATAKRASESVDALVKPVAETLENFRKHVGELEQRREHAYGALTTQLLEVSRTQEILRGETGNLVSALRSPNVRGRWGEIQLERCVELAGISHLCDFNKKLAQTEDEKRKIPDLTVNLPARKIIVVDSKVPLTAYEESQRASDAPTRERKLREHAGQVRKHIVALSQKAYWDLQVTPEFTVLFLPGEQFFGAALDADPDLSEYAAERNVIIATPTTLIAMLRAVYYGWRQEQLADNARQISELGATLYKRIATVGEYLATLGVSLNKAVDAFNKTVTSLETRVLVSARKFEDLHVAPSEHPITELTPLDITARTLIAPELAPPKLPTLEFKNQPDQLPLE